MSSPGRDPFSANGRGNNSEPQVDLFGPEVEGRLQARPRLQRSPGKGHPGPQFEDFVAAVNAEEQENVRQESLFTSGPAASSTALTRGWQRVELPAGAGEGKGPDVLDLYAGMGGFSSGFAAAGFQVLGVDRIPWTSEIFSTWNLGEARQINLLDESCLVPAQVLIGGPPCRPWSPMNTRKKRRSSGHAEQPLLERFFDHIEGIRPAVFLFENVPRVYDDPAYREGLRRVIRAGYDVRPMVLAYDLFGAATSRRRLFTVGFADSRAGATEFYVRLRERRRPATTVHAAIDWLRCVPRDAYPDHTWPNLRTLEKYSQRYRKEQYGWRRLDGSSPAPSFGNVMKTYVQPPEFCDDSDRARVLSVRELMCIMGFNRKLSFPSTIPTGRRYQMLADTVSPLVSRACAEVIREMLDGTASPSTS